MPVLPVTTVRTSFPLSNQRLLFQLNADQVALQKQYDQLSTGKRVLRLSDDPAAASRAIGLHRGIDRATQISRNAASSLNFYQSTDSSLSRVDNALIEARAVATESAQNVISEDQRAAFAATIDETINTVFASGNAMYRDHQLLGGFLNSRDAFSRVDDKILYSGAEAIARTDLGGGETSILNLNANQALGALAVFHEGQQLQAGVNAETRLVDMRYGDGITPGLIRVSGGGDWYDLDLSAATTMGDVVTLISGTLVDGRTLAASLTADGIRVEYVDGLAGTLALADAEGSEMADQLAILNRSGMNPPPLIGSGIAPAVTGQTSISDLNGGDGIDLSDGLQIIQDGEIFVVDLTAAKTVSDALIAINRSGADIRAELKGNEGRIQLRSLKSGSDYSVGENGGDAATLLGIRTATEQTLLSDLGSGQGIALNPDSPEISILRPDGVQLDLNLEGATTIGDVISLIRNHPSNQDTSRVLVDLNEYGNGLQLTAPPSAGSLAIRRVGSSNAGLRLGWIGEDGADNVGSVIGPVDTIIGSDFHTRDAGGTLDTLLRLRTAVKSGDIPEIARLQATLDLDLDRGSRARGRVGVWSRNAQQLSDVAESRLISMKSQLSDEIDADLATVVSDMSQRQLALEASMRLIGKTSQMTVLNFL
ncbi:MAG: flagellar hook protein [Planctomycetaceae bacterium TMED240]|nr:flagellar hook protein [Rhodopirellula sp.]OUX08502.1 MAG: flagellar hook protein [Planctomycetaceae bacterium TMED240]